jgi:hypothetical protein
MIVETSLKIPDKYSEIISWMKSISRYGELDNFSIVDYTPSKPQVPGEQYEVGKLNFKIFTKEHVYSISCILPYSDSRTEGSTQISGTNYPGYLGCTVSTRKPRAGETWNRGNDLADGIYSYDTFMKIIQDIVSYELVKVIKPKSDQLGIIPDEIEIDYCDPGHWGGENPPRPARKTEKLIN